MTVEAQVDQPFYVEDNIYERVTLIRAGSKLLTLAVIPSMRSAEARLDTIAGVKRIEGETTAVFSAAKQLLQADASRYGDIHFKIETLWPTMKAWCEITGRDLFGWDVYPLIDEPGGIRAEVVIKANN